MENKHRGIMQFVPLIVGTAIVLMVIVTVTLPLLNASIYNSGLGTGMGWTGTTATILAQLLPLTAVLALAVVAAVLMGVFKT